MNGSITQNYKQLVEEVGNIAERCHRSPAEVRTVVVTKYQTVQSINEVIAAGASDIAENYPEMLLPKLAGITYPTGVRWHMIGHIQSRKSDIVMDHFQMVHSIHNLKIPQKLEHRGNEIGRNMPILLEVNVGAEVSKTGYLVNSPSDLEKLFEDIRAINQMDHLDLQGLMVMPPFTSNPEDSRKHFAHLRQLLDKINKTFPDKVMTELSMGTSQDYGVAIEEGATYIRIGSKIFGEII